VGELPVEQVLETALGDDDVADPEVAVTDDSVELGWRVLAQPQQPELDRRVRFADRVELALEPREHVATTEERHTRPWNRVDPRELRA
jgi:hypothetical protein